MRRWARHLVFDECGQDLVEYALLTAFFGLCAMAAWDSLRAAVGVNYGRATDRLQSIWDPPLPSAPR